MKLDLGCGNNPKTGFIGVDAVRFAGVEVVHDLRIAPWPFADNSVDEVHCAHFIEHLTNLDGKWERVRFFNELYRILKPRATARLEFPHWNSMRWYGDPTHKEPFSEMGFGYLDRIWRKAQAPHTDAEHNAQGYNCDFEHTLGYMLHPEISARDREQQEFAMKFFKEACLDVQATLTARK